MAKKNARAAEPIAAPALATTTATTATTATIATSTSTTGTAHLTQPKSAKATANNGWDQVFRNVYDYYMKETPQRTKLIDVFLVFLVAVGALQFLYCILAGNYVGSLTSGWVMLDVELTYLLCSLSMLSSLASARPSASLSLPVWTIDTWQLREQDY
jgi:hypothetical protein